MADIIFSGIIKLRKDTVANFDAAGSKWIPANGEICIVEYRDRLRFKCGDGLHYYNNLSYLDENSGIIFYGYYLNGKFWTDSTYTVEMEKSTAYLYIDRNNIGAMYTWDGTKYNPVVLQATENVAGMMKLYNEKGSHIDGTMTQKSITDELNTKFEVSVNEDDECAVFTITL